MLHPFFYCTALLSSILSKKNQPMIIHEPATDPDEDPAVVNPSSSTGRSPPIEQRDRFRRQQRSRSRERTPFTIWPAVPTCCTSSWRASDSARSQDSGRTMLHPDLYILTDDEQWTVTPETHKYAAAAGSFLFCDCGKKENQ